MELIVAREEERLSVKSFLVRRFAGLSMMYLRGRVYQGYCAVDGVRVENWGRKLREGQRVEIEVDLEAATARRAEEIELEVIHEDEGLIVVNKPAGMLVHPTMKVKTGTVANALAWRLNGARFWFAHRLDQETSGVLLVAKSAEMLGRMVKTWKSVRKEYLAVVEGVVERERFEIDAPIGRDESCAPPWGVREGGKEALSRVEAVERGVGRTLVRLEPVTGRTNQLRIHCAHVGHAIVGDRVYGGPPGERMWLHARSLEWHGMRFVAEVGWGLDQGD
jgi:23S rRNA pseudouridine1911/1915/1917 synthase